MDPRNIRATPPRGSSSVPFEFLDQLRESVVHLAQQVDELRMTAPGPRGHPYDGTVQVKNSSGALVGFGGVLKIASMFDPYTTSATGATFDRNVYLIGTTPATTDEGLVGIAAQPMGNGIVGRCYVHGECPARVDITDSAHQFAVPKASTAELTSAASGSIQILWKPATTGVQRCIVRIGNPVTAIWPTHKQAFTNSGSWVVPAGATLVRFTVVAGGSGGGGGLTEGVVAGSLWIGPPGGGGAGGASTIVAYALPVVGDTMTITVGAPGDGGDPGEAPGGTAGGASSVVHSVTSSKLNLVADYGGIGLRATTSAVGELSLPVFGGPGGGATTATSLTGTQLLFGVIHPGDDGGPGGNGYSVADGGFSGSVAKGHGGHGGNSHFGGYGRGGAGGDGGSAGSAGQDGYVLVEW